LVGDDLDIAQAEFPQEGFEPKLDTTLSGKDVKETIIPSESIKKATEVLRGTKESISETNNIEVENKKNQQKIEKGKRKRIEKKPQENIEDMQESMSTELDDFPKKKEQATVESMKEKKTDQNKNNKTQNNAEASSFPVKLKKTEQIKRPLSEQKLETVQLKHHTFEGLPQETEKERPSGVILKLPIKQKDDATSSKILQKKKIIKNLQ